MILLALAGVMIFCFAGCRTNGAPKNSGMPDPYHTGKWVSVKKVNMTYGTDKTIVTLSKPHSATFTFYGDDPLNAGNRVELKANNNTWKAEIRGYFPGDAPFVDEYFLGDNQEIEDSGMSHMNTPIKIIRYSYKADEKTVNECFIGFEFADTEHGRGLMGIRFHSFKSPLSKNTLKGIFNELFFIER